MRNLINRILVRLGLINRLPRWMYDPYKGIGWKFTMHYGRVSDDFIVRGEIVDPIDEWIQVDE